MPDLNIPIYFGGFDLKGHLITAWTCTADKKKVVTGAMNGELIVWSFVDGQFSPILKLMPHLLYGVGGVTALQIMKRPFAEFQDSRMHCVVSIHQDKRIRLWSLLDGKLVLISDHDQFPYTRQITTILPIGERDSRYMFCFGEGSAVYIYDLWKMCCSKIFQINEEIDSSKFCFMALHGADFAIVDTRFRIYKLDTKNFKKPERQNYLKYVEKRQVTKKSPAPKKPLMRLASAYSLKGLPSQRIITSMYHNKSGLLYIVYPRQIAIVWQPFLESEQQREMCFLTSSNAVVKFRNVHSIKQNDLQLVIVETVDGACSILFERDILDIMNILRQGIHSGVTLGFGGFSFQKQTNTCIGQLQIILRDQLNTTSQSKYFYQQQTYIIGEQIVRQQSNRFEVYNITDLQADPLRFCSLEPIHKTKLQSEGFTLYVNIDSYYVDEKSKSHNLQLQPITTELSQESNILSFLVNKAHPLIGQITEKICVYTIGLYNKSDLFVFIGTFCGKVYAIPFFENLKKEYRIYSYQVSRHAIIRLLFRKNSLFCVDHYNALNVFGFSAIFGKFEYQNNEFIPTYTGTLPSNIRQSLQIRELFSENSNFSMATAQQVKRKVIKHLIALQLEDDSVFVYHTTWNQKKYILTSQTKESGQIVKLFYMPQFMYFLMYSQANINIWSIERGSLERVVNIDVLQANLNLEAYLTKFQMANPHDFRLFKTEQVSQLDLLEFSNRSFHTLHNFSKEIKQMGKAYFYDAIGLMSRVNNLEYQELLEILFQDYQVQSTKSLAIFEIEKSTSLFPLIRSYLAQYKSSKPFDKMNKNYKGQDSPHEPYFLIWFDCKQNIHRVQESLETTLRMPLTFLNFYQPCTQRPLFYCQYGMQGMGEGFSRAVKPNEWQISGLMSTQFAVAAVLGLKSLKPRFQISELGDLKTSLMSLARYSLDEDKQLIEISCQLMLTQIKKSNQLSNDLLTLHRSSKDFLHFFERNGANQFFSLEIMCLIIQTYLSQQMVNNDEMNNYIFNRMNSNLTAQLCITRPKLMFTFLKLLDDGMQIFNTCIQNPKAHMQNIMLLYYYVYSAYKNPHFLAEVLNQQGQKNKKDKEKEREREKFDILRQFSQMDRESLKRMVVMLRRVIMTHNKYFFEEFKHCLKEYLQINHTHPLINSCMIDLMLNISKEEIQPKDLQIFLDNSIKTIDQITPVSRRQSYKVFQKFIVYLDQRFKYVSYSRERQKLAFADEGIIQIYDLRYGVKLSSLDRYQSQITSIAFDCKGAKLATYSSRDQNIKVFELKPTGSFLQSFENVYIKISHQFNNVRSGEFKLAWDEDSEYIYLVESDTSIVFKIE